MQIAWVKKKKINENLVLLINAVISNLEFYKFAINYDQLSGQEVTDVNKLFESLTPSVPEKWRTVEQKL